MTVSDGIVFERYRLLRELGRGGEAVVHLAFDERLGRQVALKIFQGAPVIGDGAMPERVQREIEALGRLDHPGICRIHAAGIESGIPFIAMSYVEGAPLREAPRAADPVRMVADVARTVAAAHAVGVVHGDVTPDNVLVTAAGRCVLVDFGLVRLLDEKRSDGARPAGTIAYLAPECLGGPPTVRSDVFALGAVLYEMVTGRTPLVAPTREAMVSKMAHEAAPLARSVARTVSKDLEAILAKATDPDPARRYDSAAAFADDLDRLTRGEAIAARRPGIAGRMLRWARRRPAVAALAAFATVFVAAASYVVVSKRAALDGLMTRASRESERAGRELADASAHLTRHARLADERRLADLEARAETLLPPSPSLRPALEEWMRDAQALVARLPAHRAELELLRGRGKRGPARRAGGSTAAREVQDLRRREPALGAMIAADADRESQRKLERARKNLVACLEKLEAAIPVAESWTFESEDDAWQNTTLPALIDALARFETAGVLGGMRDVARRIEETGVVGAALSDPRWDAARRSIADRAQCPAYAGLSVQPQPGLVPLARNPATGLWEFLCVLSGEAPPIRADGALELAPEHGLVLVLLPGGDVKLGARRPGPGDAPDGPHVDGGAAEKEGPVDDVRLAPFFVSKYEMTAAQWRRARGAAPAHSLMPAASLSWYDAVATAKRLGLALPTEAQWEYAARAGTTTPWWTGPTPDRLEEREHFGVKAVRRDPVRVGSLASNAFGLYDVAGNVAEWCLDEFLEYANPTEGPAGQRLGLRNEHRVRRGGWFSAPAIDLRTARRAFEDPVTPRHFIGLRPVLPVEDRRL
jgi:formylglycine-generating enzyme required for sulfatase activity